MADVAAHGRVPSCSTSVTIWPVVPSPLQATAAHQQVVVLQSPNYKDDTLALRHQLKGG